MQLTERERYRNKLRLTNYNETFELKNHNKTSIEWQSESIGSEIDVNNKSDKFTENLLQRVKQNIGSP